MNRSSNIFFAFRFAKRSSAPAAGGAFTEKNSREYGTNSREFQAQAGINQIIYQ
jgi:hypothetical protein